MEAIKVKYFKELIEKYGVENTTVDKPKAAKGFVSKAYDMPDGNILHIQVPDEKK